MMPNLTSLPIMEYVRRLETRVRTLQAARDRVERKTFWIGVLWGASLTAVIGWYLLRSNGG